MQQYSKNSERLKMYCLSLKCTVYEAKNGSRGTKNITHTSLSCTPLSKANCTRPMAVSCESAFKLYFVLKEKNIRVELQTLYFVK